MQISFQTESTKLPLGAALVVFTSETTDNLVLSSDGAKEVHIGRGKERKVKATRRELILLIRRAVNTARTRGVKTLAIDLTQIPQRLSEAELTELVAKEATLANYEFTAYKKTPEKGWSLLETLVIVGTRKTSEAKARRGQRIGEIVNDARSLTNTPANRLSPADVAQVAREQLTSLKVAVTEFDRTGLQELGAGGILAVGQGSVHEPRLIVLEYNGGKKGEKPVVIVGKGITHDSGGYSIKPPGSMTTMHMDMAGAAAVIGAMRLAAEQKIKKNIVGLVASAENMISGSSYREGDIIRMMDGTTVEIANTDAEGRLVLGDALVYAKRFKPKAVIDIATLTGGAVVAVGYRMGGVLSQDERLMRLTKEAGELTGDYVWELPLWDEFDSEIKSPVADIMNMGKYARSASATIGAAFLKTFTKDYPWLHIDMAPRMDVQDFDQLVKGALGYGVHLLHRLLETV